MGVTVHTLEVMPGQATEYSYSFLPESNSDSMVIIFDKDFTIDDLMVQFGGGAITYSMSLVYPVSQLSIPLVATQTDDNWYLNEGSSSRDMWFRVPNGTKLEITLSGTLTSGTLAICIIGR